MLTQPILSESVPRGLVATSGANGAVQSILPIPGFYPAEGADQSYALRLGWFPADGADQSIALILWPAEGADA